MNPKHLFKGLTPEQEQTFAQEATERWGAESVKQSQKA